MKTIIKTGVIFLLTVYSVFAQDCEMFPAHTNYVLSGNFTQNNSNDHLINDIVMLNKISAATITSDSFTIDLLTSDGSGERVLQKSTNVIYYDLTKVNGRMVRGDFDNDGHIDDFILIYKTGPSSMRFDLFKSNGASTPTFTQSTVYTLDGYDPDKITGRVVSGDFDGDNYWDDIAVFYDYGNGETRIHTFRSNVNTFLYSSSVGWWNSTGYTASRVTHRVVSGDFDHDGKVDDIAAFYDYGNGETRIHVWISNGSSFSYQSSFGWWNATGYSANKITGRVISLNMDRDGYNYDDIAVFYDYGPGNYTMHVFESNGTSFEYANGPTGWWNSGSSSIPVATHAFSMFGKLVEIDSRKWPNQGKPSDIIVFNAVMPTYTSIVNYDRYQFWEVKKGLTGPKVEYSTPKYCESKSTNKTDFDALDDNVNIITYPNPTKGLFTVEVPNYWLNKDTVIEIRNLFGEVVFSEKIDSSIMKIDLTNKTSGIYILKISNSEQSITRKIIKE